MKIIFLDFDGVLNSERYLRTHGANASMFDPECMLLLKDIVSATNAKIVLTTSWREHWSENKDECSDIGMEINEAFADYGLEIYSKTPHIGFGNREAEIEDWLSENPYVGRFVVIDDAFLESDVIDGHFVRTSGFFGGLSENDALEAIKILGK